MSSSEDLIGELDSFLQYQCPSVPGIEGGTGVNSQNQIMIPNSEHASSPRGNHFHEKRKMEDSENILDNKSNPPKIRKMDSFDTGNMKEEPVDHIGLRRSGSLGNLHGSSSLMNMSGGILKMEPIKKEPDKHFITGLKMESNMEQAKQESQDRRYDSSTSIPSTGITDTRDGVQYEPNGEGNQGRPDLGDPNSWNSSDIGKTGGSEMRQWGNLPLGMEQNSDKQRASTAARIRGALESSGLSGNLTPQDLQTLKRLNEIAKSTVLTQEQKSNEASQLLKNNPNVSRLLLKLRTEMNTNPRTRIPVNGLDGGIGGGAPPVGSIQDTQQTTDMMGHGVGSPSHGEMSRGPTCFNPQSNFGYPAEGAAQSPHGPWSEGPRNYFQPNHLGAGSMIRGERPYEFQQGMMDRYPEVQGSQIRPHLNQSGKIGHGYQEMAAMHGTPGDPRHFIRSHDMGSQIHGNLGGRMGDRSPGTMYLNRQTGQMMFPDQMMMGGQGGHPRPPVYPGHGGWGPPPYMSTGARRPEQIFKTNQEPHGGGSFQPAPFMDHQRQADPYHRDPYERGSPYLNPGEFRPDHNLLTSKFNQGTQPSSPKRPSVIPPQTESQLRARLSQQNISSTAGSDMTNNRLPLGKRQELGGLKEGGGTINSTDLNPGTERGSSLFDEINNSQFGHFNSCDSTATGNNFPLEYQHQQDISKGPTSWKAASSTGGLRTTLLNKLITAVESSPNIPPSEAAKMATDIENKAFFTAETQDHYMNNVAVQLAKIFSQSKSNTGGGEGNNVPDSTSNLQSDQTGPSSTTSIDTSIQSSTSNNNTVTGSHDNGRHYHSNTSGNCFQEGEPRDIAVSSRLGPNIGDLGHSPSHQATNVIVGSRRPNNSNQPHSVDSGIGSPRSIPATIYSPDSGSVSISNKGTHGVSPNGLGSSPGGLGSSPGVSSGGLSASPGRAGGIYGGPGSSPGRSGVLTPRNHESPAGK